MNRRHVIALGTAALGSTLLPTIARAEDLSPVAIAEFGQGRDRAVIRVYQGDRPGEVLVHVRQGGRATRRRMRISGDPEGMMRGLTEDGRATFSGNGISVNVTTTGSRGTFNVEGAGPINIVTDNTAVIVVPLGVFVVAAVATAFLQGFVIGYVGSRVIDATSSGGEASAEAESEEEDTGEGIIASPECDGPPIRLC